MATNVWPAMRTITNEDEEENRKMFVANSPKWREKKMPKFLVSIPFSYSRQVTRTWTMYSMRIEWNSKFSQKKNEIPDDHIHKSLMAPRMVRWLLRWRPYKPRQTVRSIEYEKLRCRSREHTAIPRMFTGVITHDYVKQMCRGHYLMMAWPSSTDGERVRKIWWARIAIQMTAKICLCFSFDYYIYACVSSSSSLFLSMRKWRKCFLFLGVSSCVTQYRRYVLYTIQYMSWNVQSTQTKNLFTFQLAIILW